LPRLYVDWGKFDKAESVIKQNIDSMKKATGSDKDDDLVAVYLKEALLGNYFWQKRATGEASADKRKEYQKKADLALMAFADRYAEKPEIISAFMNIVAQKYGEVENVEDAPLLVLVAAANRANSEGKFPKAERFLKEALGRTDDDLAAQLMPMALWEMAMLKNKMGKNVEAADAFLKIAIEYPKSGRAPQAAKFATISYNKLINLRAQEGVVAQNLREKFIEALTIYTDGWGGKPEVDKWYYDLGWQYRHLAEASSGPEREERVQASIAAFEKVPSELPEAIESRFRALEMRYERLQLASNDTDAKEEEIRSEARTLAEGFRKYARDARERARTDANEARGKSIFNWGARAEFNAAVIRHRFLNDRAARTILAGLEERWPGTDVLEASAEKAIRWDLDQGRIDQAVKKYREFTQQYSKDKTRALTRLIGKTMAADIAELKARIQRTSSVEVREAAEKELAARQKQWPQLAKQAYQDAKADVEARDLPDEAIYAEHYDVVVMQGNALLEADRPNEALEIFQGLKKYQDQLKAQYQAEVDEFFETEKKRLDRGSSDRRFVLGRFADLNKYLMERGFDPEDISYTEEVAAAIERLDSPEVKTVDDRQKALAEVVERLKKAYDRLQVEVRKSYPVDPNTIRGLALAYSSMEGEEALQKAADYHRRRLRLVERANLQDYPPEDRAAVVRLFWEAQLDYAQFALKANKDRPGQLRLLIRRINQLQETDPQMGGLLAQFKAAERKAKDLARV
ncbi:MAG: tetratricopeptide repeat protein, partial [Phycisphaerae bacterium]